MRKKILFISLICLLSVSVFGDKKHHIDGDAPIGTKFKSKAATLYLPFDKPCKELTYEQKQMFRANYADMPADEIPPFPKDGLQAIYKPMIRAHKKLLREGKLYAVAMVSEEGKVEKVEVYESPSKHMAEMAVTVLYNTEFDPPQCGDKKCKMEFPLDMNLEVSY